NQRNRFLHAIALLYSPPRRLTGGTMPIRATRLRVSGSFTYRPDRDWLPDLSCPCWRRLLARRGWRDDALQPQVHRHGAVHLIAMNTEADEHQAACALDGADLHQLQHALIGHAGDERIAEGR